MSDVIMTDNTGKPRPKEDIEAALKALTTEVVRNPMAILKDGSPALMHYIVVIDAMRELLILRGAAEILRRYDAGEKI